MPHLIILYIIGKHILICLEVIWKMYYMAIIVLDALMHTRFLKRMKKIFGNNKRQINESFIRVNEWIFFISKRKNLEISFHRLSYKKITEPFIRVYRINENCGIENNFFERVPAFAVTFLTTWTVFNNFNFLVLNCESEFISVPYRRSIH